MHKLDTAALCATLIGAGSWSGSVISLGLKLPIGVTITLLALGAAGQAASQYLRIKGSPSGQSGTGANGTVNPQPAPESGQKASQ